MARKALIETATGKVVNIIALEDGADWQPPMGHHVQDARDAGPGDTWDGAKFIPQPELPVPLDPNVGIRKAIESAATLTELKTAILRLMVTAGNVPEV